jgi:hypothetical protein
MDRRDLAGMGDDRVHKALRLVRVMMVGMDIMEGILVEILDRAGRVRSLEMIDEKVLFSMMMQGPSEVKRKDIVFLQSCRLREYELSSSVVGPLTPSHSYSFRYNSVPR